VRGLTFDWGSRTFVMGIVNVTPDSFSGDGLLAGDDDPASAAVTRAQRMVAEGADLLDIGGESTRPGHVPVGEAEELERVVPVIREIRRRLPDVPLSVDTTKARVAAAAIDAGADILNDVGGIGGDDGIVRLSAARGLPYVLMHARALAPDDDAVAEVVADLRRGLERASRLGCRDEQLVVDPGIGFGKSPAQNLALLRGLAVMHRLRRPILLGASRKSTIGRVLDLPPGDRLEGTLATTALGIAAGVDIVRVHDVLANVRAARMADAIVRGWRDAPAER
jgi:dihydropteroate synthase